MLPKSSRRVAVVIKLANQVAREYEQEYVGTEHMLLAILTEGTGIGSTLLAGRGVTDENLREEIAGL
ncbi:MAG: Clp protease N-terminal domain-containing protein, partial [Planctomycetes bacterium]|nr:Clp protease N-terminal domain-containing protein [Planctomycetota bacterium]